MPRGLYIRTEAHKKASIENLSKANSAPRRQPYKHSEETKQKIREKRKLQKMPIPSQETRQKMSAWQIGKIMSDETKNKISKNKTGKKQNLTENQRRERSERMIGNSHTSGKKFPNKKMPKASMETRIKMSEAKKGDKCHAWKGGVSDINKILRKRTEIKIWRFEVFKRDNYTCQKCHVSATGKLNAHHIHNFADFPDMREVVDNGVTLCKDCHVEFHVIYGRKNNTKQQLDEYLNTKENIYYMAI